MYKTLLLHQWKYFLRSKSLGKNIVGQIIIALFGLYFLCGAFFIGFSLKSIIQQQYGITNMVSAFCSFILYYFVIDFAVRFLWQELPTLAIQPYLIQNIRRKQLVLFLNIRSLFSFFNFIPLLLFIPFALSVISRQYGDIATSTFIVSILALCAGNNFLILFIKRQTINSNYWLIGFLGVLFSCGALSYFHIISIRVISANAFISIINTPWLSIILVLYAAIATYVNSRLLKNNFYFESTAMYAVPGRLSGNIWFQKTIVKGSLFDIDAKLILRNKRPRSMMMLSLLFLFYGFIMFKKSAIENGELGIPLFGSLITIGMFVITYGQFLFAWQSSYFDGLLSNNVNGKIYIKSKFRLITIFCTITFLISFLYVLIDWRIAVILCAAYLYNIGIQPIIAIYFANLNYKGLDISKLSSFNYQGVGATQWIYSFIVLLIAAVIYIPFYLFHNAWFGIIGLGTIGLINFLLQDWWVNILYRQFIKNKYKILQGFREK